MCNDADFKKTARARGSKIFLSFGISSHTWKKQKMAH